MDSVFDLLREIPLFQGASSDALASVAGSTKFDFRKYGAGDVVCHVGDPCVEISFIISGEVRAIWMDEERNVSVAQTLGAPASIASEFLFGRSTQMPYTVMALTPVSLLAISKRDFINILSRDNVFLFNFLNFLSSRAQEGLTPTRGDSGLTIEEKIVEKVKRFSLRNATNITLSCRKGTLAPFLGISDAELAEAVGNLGSASLNEITID